MLLRRAVLFGSRFGPVHAHAAKSRHRVHTCSTSSLLQNLQRGKDINVEVQTIEVASRTVQVLVADCDAVMEMYIAAGQGDRDPYWTCVWPSSVAMAEEILARPELVAGRRVADLGCGLGVGGVAAAMAGAAEVVLLDREPLAIQCALINAKLNGFHEVSCLGEVQVDVQLDVEQRALETWTSLSTSSATVPLSHHKRNPQTNIRWSVFDWSARLNDALVGRFDVILACDVLYEQFSVEPVGMVVPKLLRNGRSGEDSRLLLCDPPLRAKHNREAFIQLMNGQGYVAEECGERQASVFNETKRVHDQVPIVFMSFRHASMGDTVGVKRTGWAGLGI